MAVTRVAKSRREDGLQAAGWSVQPRFGSTLRTSSQASPEEGLSCQKQRVDRPPVSRPPRPRRSVRLYSPFAKTVAGEHCRRDGEPHRVAAQRGRQGGVGRGHLRGGSGAAVGREMRGFALAPSVRLEREPFPGAVLAVTLPCTWSPVFDAPILLRSVDGRGIIPISAHAALALWSLAMVANVGLLPPSAPDARDQ